MFRHHQLHRRRKPSFTMRSLGERSRLLRKRVRHFQTSIVPKAMLNCAHSCPGQQLINLQCGAGAAILPPEVSRIHLDFAGTLRNGHMGPRKFWRENLPRLKYHNPSIPMIVNRHDHNENPATMTVYFRDTPLTAPIDTLSQPSSSRNNLSKAAAPSPGERVVHIDMTNQHSSHILELFLAQTKAVALQPTAEQIAEIQALEALEKKGTLDRERVRLLMAEKKKEEDMLKRARAAGGMAEQEEA